MFPAILSFCGIASYPFHKFNILKQSSVYRQQICDKGNKHSLKSYTDQDTCKNQRLNMPAAVSPKEIIQKPAANTAPGQEKSNAYRHKKQKWLINYKHTKYRYNRFFDIVWYAFNQS